MSKIAMVELLAYTENKQNTNKVVLKSVLKGGDHILTIAPQSDDYSIQEILKITNNSKINKITLVITSKVCCPLNVLKKAGDISIICTKQAQLYIWDKNIYHKITIPDADNYIALTDYDENQKGVSYTPGFQFSTENLENYIDDERYYSKIQKSVDNLSPMEFYPYSASYALNCIISKWIREYVIAENADFENTKYIISEYNRPSVRTDGYKFIQKQVKNSDNKDSGCMENDIVKSKVKAYIKNMIDDPYRHYYYLKHKNIGDDTYNIWKLTELTPMRECKHTVSKLVIDRTDSLEYLICSYEKEFLSKLDLANQELLAEILDCHEWLE